MAKIDTSKIAGYADMTPEQKIAALEAYEDETIDDSETEKEKLKKAVAKANAEAADYKKQLRAKQSAEEAKAAEQESTYKELQEKYDTLLRTQTISSYAARLVKQGYDEKLAESTAKAMIDGDYDTVLKNGDTHRATIEQSIRANMTKETPHPQNGSLGGAKKYTDKSEIMKIKDASERQQAIKDNFELFEN